MNSHVFMTCRGLGVMMFAKCIAVCKTYLRSQTGATAIEYGLIAALISMGIAFAVFAFGDSLRSLFYDDLGAVLASLVG